MSDNRFHSEEFSVKGEEVVSKVKQLIKQGNIRKVIIKDKTGKILAEFPLTIGVVGLALAPFLITIGAVAALLTEATIVVEKNDTESGTS